MQFASAALILVLLAGPAWAHQDDQERVSREEFERLKKEIEELKGRPGALQEEAPDLTTEEGQERSGLYSRLGSFSGNVHIGGYIDLEFVNREDSNSDSFDQHRFVPFIYADVTDAIKVSVELEIEHGNEVGIEFATVDYWAEEWLNIRAGIILLPLGQFNLMHDAPFQDLTARPLVDTYVIPVVLRDPGLSLFGRIDADPWIFDYEIAVSNGFKGLNKDGSIAEISTDDGLRDARPHKGGAGSGKYRDFNDNKSVTARLGVSPFLGLGFGLSYHFGKYDERGDGDLQIAAFDLAIEGGGLHRKLFGGDGVLRDILFATEIAFEYAQADVERTAVSPAGQPEDLDGLFVEIRYHFFFEALRALPGMTDESTFTAVFRYGSIEIEDAETERFTIGLNLRPVESTVFKFEYQFNEEGGAKAEKDDDAFLFSVASYF